MEYVRPPRLIDDDVDHTPHEKARSLFYPVSNFQLAPSLFED